MLELERGGYSRVRPLFEDTANIPPRSVLSGITPGRVFVDDVQDPQAALVWTQWGFAYLAGESCKDAFTRDLHDLILEELVPNKGGREKGFLLFPCSSTWEAESSLLLAGRRPNKIYRRSFTFNPSHFSGNYGWLNRLPAGFHIYRIDEKLIERTGDRISQEIEAAWASVKDFLNDGFGFCLMHGEEIVSLCTSPFIAGREVEVCIRTDPHYRSKGYATVTALAFLEHCLLNDLSPNWECPWDHIASCALAARLGFENPVDRLVYYWEELSQVPGL
jgi:RimJ/RimL family protein N-acetyltransferase